MFWYDSTMILLLPAIIITFWAQMRVNSTFERYSRISSKNGYTGAVVARMLLDSEGLQNVLVEMVSGKLTDHYDPKNRVMRLSHDVYSGTSVAAIGVAAHETGHAFQHKESYSPLVLRNAIVPVATIGSNASWVLFFLGMVLGVTPLVNFGIILFAAVVLFHMVTLPVEFNASSRALKVLESKTILYDDELKGAKAVLKAAAMTYVAAALMAVSQLIRLWALGRHDE